LKNKLRTSALFLGLFSLGTNAQNTTGAKGAAAQSALAEAKAAAGEPARGVALRDKGLTFLYEDAGNIFYLMDSTVKPFQDSGFAFAFDVRRDYKIEDKKNPEDIGLKEHFLVKCDKGIISAPLVQHLRGDGMIGKLEPVDFSKGMYQPAPSSYEYKALNYVCSSRLGEKYKMVSPATRDPLPTPIAALPVAPKEPVVNKKSPTTEIPPPQDIGKFVVVFQPDASLYYPSFSKRSGEQGDVVVRLIVGDDGTVEDVQLLRSSSFPRLDRAATEIGKRYRFKPFMVNGKPTKVSTNLLIKFHLKTDEEKGVKPKFESNPLTTGG
jgi:TonB family protein